MPPTQFATLPAPPSTLPVWGKMLWYLAKTVAGGAAYKAFDYALEIQSSEQAEGDPPANTWRKFSVRVENNLSTETADDQYVNFEVAKYTNGTLDSDWDDSAYNAVWSSLAVIVAGMMQSAPSYLTATEVKAYVRGFNPYTLDKPFFDSGPPDWFDTFTVIGGASGSQVPQVCSSVTEQTPVRKHWGRYYTPTVNIGQVGTNGRFTTAYCDSLAQLVHDNYGFLYSVGFPPVVATTVTGMSKSDPDGTPLRSLQTVTGVRVDDVPDIIRRRRYRHATYRKVLPLPTELESQAAE